MRILGIDPGTSRIGFGLIETEGGLRLLKFGTIEATEKTLPEKISAATGQLRTLLKELRPEFVGIEKLFFAKNTKTAISVAQSRGAIISVLMEHGLPIAEFSPTEVKSQVAGHGLADKKSVAKMVGVILKVKELPGYDDASDALAIAIAAAGQQKLLTRKFTSL